MSPASHRENCIVMRTVKHLKSQLTNQVSHMKDLLLGSAQISLCKLGIERRVSDIENK
jgi:hypothetical protein